MINHLRTLLLNLVPATMPIPGEEYVPAAFQPQFLPQDLASVRNLLFGPSPDRAMLNYRLREYLTLVHSTELESHVLDLDPRVTYWPPHDIGLFKDALLGSVITLIAGSTTWGINIIGNPSGVKNNSFLLTNWQIRVLDASSINVKNLTQGLSTTYPYTVTNGLTGNIPLTGSTLSFILTVGNTIYPTWGIQHLARPLLELPDIYAGLNAGINTGVNSLFVSDQEPYKTCHQLWVTDNVPIAYKLGAIVTALGYKLNALYTNSV
jgi:hypothetical protein